MGRVGRATTGRPVSRLSAVSHTNHRIGSNHTLNVSQIIDDELQLFRRRRRRRRRRSAVTDLIIRAVNVTRRFSGIAVLRVSYVRPCSWDPQ